MSEPRIVRVRRDEIPEPHEAPFRVGRGDGYGCCRGWRDGQGTDCAPAKTKSGTGLTPGSAAGTGLVAPPANLTPGAGLTAANPAGTRAAQPISPNTSTKAAATSGAAALKPAVNAVRPAATAASGTAPVVGTPCTTNDTDTRVPGGGTDVKGIACIANFWAQPSRVSLGYVGGGTAGVTCIEDPRALVQNAVYLPSDCRGPGWQSEAIAQARVIAQLNKTGVYNDSAASGITPNLQWEVKVPGGSLEPDLVLYDHTSTTGDVGLVEMKGNWNPKNPYDQVTEQVNQWPAGSHKVMPYHFTAFDDKFEINLGACKNAPGQSSKLQYHTHTDPNADGVLWVDENTVRCPDDSKTGNLRTIFWQGTVGADDVKAGVDDLLNEIENHPETWPIGLAPLAGIQFHPLPNPVNIRLSEEFISEIEVMLEEAGPQGENAAWAAIVD